MVNVWHSRLIHTRLAESRKKSRGSSCNLVRQFAVPLYKHICRCTRLRIIPFTRIHGVGLTAVESAFYCHDAMVLFNPVRRVAMSIAHGLGA